MQATEIRAIVQMAVQSCAVGDAAAFAALFASDGQLVLPGAVLTGRDAIQPATATYFATLTAIEIAVANVIVEGDRAAVEWRWQATERATGQRVQAENAIALDFRGGWIVRWREYLASKTVLPPASSTSSAD